MVVKGVFSGKLRWVSPHGTVRDTVGETKAEKERAMRLPRVRFTMRRLMVVIGLLAMLMAGAIELTEWARARYHGQSIVKTYYVGDLIGANTNSTGPAVSLTVAGMAGQIKGLIAPDYFWFGTASVTPFNLSTSVIVRHTKQGHERIGNWLRSQRVELERGKR
jgi:hypothetical protein